jgi:hypothetical protein
MKGLVFIFTRYSSYAFSILTALSKNSVSFNEASPQTDEAKPKSKASHAKPQRTQRKIFTSWFLNPNDLPFFASFARKFSLVFVQLKNLTQN